MTIKYIAEVALCHKGSKRLAKKFIINAKKIKADILKFHLLIADEISDKQYKYYDLFKSFEISEKDWIEISKFAKLNGIKLAFDILGIKSLKIAIKCGVKIIKLHATDIYNYPLHEAIKNSGAHTIIISAGGCEKKEIIKLVKKLKNKKIVIIFGYQIYPTKSKNLYLSKISKIKSVFDNKKNIKFAYADHSSHGMLETIYNCSSAISHGAEIIEKHFTFDKSIKTDTDKSNFNIAEFNKMKKLIDNCYKKESTKNWLNKDELLYRRNVSRSFYAKKIIKKNQKITFNNLELKRGKKSPKIHIDQILNKRVKKNILKGEEIDKNKIKI